MGYEISTRIGVVLGRTRYRFWHNTGTVGAFGAAAAAGCSRTSGRWTGRAICGASPPA
ncbi:hypothetical protein AVHM3334_17105 [Acidovorax sp. SUPP3334]|nr:hypothetical protein AVHM3334_17105 [Acidovorax sp. SUPP3334]